jgi:DNA processing protein
MDSSVKSLRDEPSFNWFRLFITKGLSLANIHRICARARSVGLTIAKMTQLPEEEFIRIFQPKGAEKFRLIHQIDESESAEEYLSLLEKGISLYSPEHELYPKRLLTLYLDGAPVMLFAKGDIGLLCSASMTAVVGSRDADIRALEEARKIAGALASAGSPVVSGYARGVDYAAHLGALEAGGKTVMVLSHGLNRFTPKSELSSLPLEQQALIISQFHPDAVWQQPYGIIRNRLIVGLSGAVVVIQSAIISGTMNTGRAALKAGIPLFILSPEFFDIPPEGNIELINQGAIEFQDCEDLLCKMDGIKFNPECCKINPQSELDIK